MKIKDFISAGFYINLDYRTDRNQHMIDELTNHNLIDVVKRFSAVKAFDKTEYIRNDDSKMLSATLAAAESHKQIMSKRLNHYTILVY